MSLPDRLNVVRGFAAYSPADLPKVEVSLSTTGHHGDGTWVPGGLRMHTQHEDGSLTFTVQYSLDGHRRIDNFPEGQVRRA